MIPGVNLLAQAFAAIGQQSIKLHKFTGRSPNELGQYVTTYADPIDILGSWQPISKTRYAALGLDMTKEHAMLYTPVNIQTIERDGSGDQASIYGKRWQALDLTDWFYQDGWNAVVFGVVDDE